MSTKFSQSFKIQAVQKALNRSDSVSIPDIALSLGIARSTLQRWITEAREQKLESKTVGDNMMKQEKKPQDWSTEERFNLILRCDGLEVEAINELCREQGIYPHHIKQWKEDFVTGNIAKKGHSKGAETKPLKQEIKALKKELNRKEKALAETAALLVLQKKVHDIWGTDEDNLQ